MSECLYVCMSVCLSICLSVCLYVRTYVCMSGCSYVCMSVRTYVCTYVCTYVPMYVRMYMYVRIHVCMYQRTYVLTYVRMYVGKYVSMYACMHVRMYACMHVCMHARMHDGRIYVPGFLGAVSYCIADAMCNRTKHNCHWDATKRPGWSNKRLVCPKKKAMWQMGGEVLQRIGCCLENSLKLSMLSQMVPLTEWGETNRNQASKDGDVKWFKHEKSRFGLSWGFQPANWGNFIRTEERSIARWSHPSFENSDLQGPW